MNIRVCENGIYRDLPAPTPEELAQAQKQEVLYRIREKSSPLTDFEVFSILLAQKVQEIEVDDNTALRMSAYYPAWEAGKAYPMGYKLTRNGNLYKVVQAHSSQVGWEPENAPALFAQINERHAGTMDDPIPYSGNMALEQGKLYYQNDEIYVCVRDTVNPVYHTLAELVGLYVEVYDFGGAD